MLNPTVSVIVPVFNVAKYLRKCLDSILAQSERDIEILCGDGGSKDGSLEILREYEQNDKRIHVISKPGSGYGESVNDCIKIAKGSYIGIVESDDFIAPNMYRDMVRIAKKCNADIVRADFYSFYEEPLGAEKKTYNVLMKHKRYYNRIINPQNERELYRSWLTTWSGIYKRTWLLENDIWHNQSPGAAFQDVGFWFQTMCYAHRIVFLRHPYYYWRQDNPNASVKCINTICSHTYNEYKNIWDNLSKTRSIIGDTNRDVLCWRQFCSYMWVANQLSGETLRRHMKMLKSDFNNLDKEGYLDLSFFRPKEISFLKQVLTSENCEPQDFFAMNGYELRYLAGLPKWLQRVICAYFIYGIKYIFYSLKTML
mgnify:CR=1 FL=1